MRQSLSRLTRWVVAGVLAGLATVACAGPSVINGGFLYVGGTFTPINVPGAVDTQPRDINNAGHIVGSFHVGTGTRRG